MRNKSIKSGRVKVFLNHASQDKPLVRKLYEALKAEQWLDPWLDEERILPGQDWQNEIDKALNNSDAVIVCLSKTSISKIGLVQAEIRKAKQLQELRPEGHIFMIPVLLEECQIPDSLNKYQWVNISKPGKLLQVIASLQLLKQRKEEIFSNRRMLSPLPHEESILPPQLTNPVDLRKFMNQKYDLESLQVLCFDLDVPYQNLPSRGLSAKIVDLIEYCKRHNKYPRLLQIVLNEHS